MEKSKVYYTSFRSRNDESTTHKLQRLIKKAGLDSIDLDGKFVAIKMHFGELGNLSFLRPNYAKAVADYVKEKGGKPFLTDCNTLYPGSRKNALDHLTCAEINGFSTLSTGCHVIIGDGLRGTDEVDVPIHNGKLLEVAHIGRAIMDADVFISLTHFKGHESTGFGGTLKNIGMGCGSRAGKMAQHSDGKPVVNPSKCRNCHFCSKECGSDAISYETGKAYIHPELCKGCGRCIGACAFDAIRTLDSSSNKFLGEKIAEYSMAVCYGRPCFHISLVMDISPNCDCHGSNDAPILPDIGMLASFDPVALDKACVDLCNASKPIRESQLGEQLEKHAPTGDFFYDSNHHVDSTSCINHAYEIGLGNIEYELIKME